MSITLALPDENRRGSYTFSKIGRVENWQKMLCQTRAYRQVSKMEDIHKRRRFSKLH